MMMQQHGWNRLVVAVVIKNENRPKTMKFEVEFRINVHVQWAGHNKR